MYKNVEYMGPNSWYTYIRCNIRAFQRGFCFQYTFGRFVIGEEALKIDYSRKATTTVNESYVQLQKKRAEQRLEFRMGFSTSLKLYRAME